MSRPKLVGNHNRCWIWGRNVVLETLRAAVWQPLELLVSPRCSAEVYMEVQRSAGQTGILFNEVPDETITRRCRSEEHQGLAALLPEYPYSRLEDLLDRDSPLRHWLVLDAIQDSFNFGAMLRSAVEFGTEGMLIGSHAQSAVNSQVVRSSAGAVNHVPIVRAQELPAAIQSLKDQGVRIIAASEKATLPLQEVDLTGSTAIVIGNEGRGVSTAVWDLCDERVRIPTCNRVGSLNAAVAAGIICYERVRQCQTCTGGPACR